MNTLCERLNLSTDAYYPNNAVSIDRDNNINFHDTLRIYCTENNIDLSNIDDDDFMSTADIIKNFGEYRFNFWIDK